MRFWRQLHDILRQPGSKAVMVTVFEVVGSSPCAPGTRMIATSDGEIFGTIGGGMLEWESQREAREFLQGAPAKRRWKVRKLLGPDLGQCCGGGVTLLFECFFHADLKEVRQLAAAEDRGIEQHAVDRLICPIGITGITGKEPAVIAASVAAQLLTYVGTASDSTTVAAPGASA